MKYSKNQKDIAKNKGTNNFYQCAICYSEDEFCYWSNICGISCCRKSMKYKKTKIKEVNEQNSISKP